MREGNDPPSRGWKGEVCPGSRGGGSHLLPRIQGAGRSSAVAVEPDSEPATSPPRQRPHGPKPPEAPARLCDLGSVCDYALFGEVVCWWLKSTLVGLTAAGRLGFFGRMGRRWRWRPWIWPRLCRCVGIWTDRHLQLSGSSDAFSQQRESATSIIVVWRAVERRRRQGRATAGLRPPPGPVLPRPDITCIPQCRD